MIIIPSSYLEALNVAVADGGGTIRVEIPQGAILWHVAVFPQDVSVPETNVKADLVNRDSDVMRTEVLPLGIAFSNATFKHANTLRKRVMVPDDRPVDVLAVIYNLTGASVNWNLVVIVEDMTVE